MFDPTWRFEHIHCSLDTFSHLKSKLWHFTPFDGSAKQDAKQDVLRYQKQRIISEWQIKETHNPRGYLQVI